MLPWEDLSIAWRSFQLCFDHQQTAPIENKYDRCQKLREGLISHIQYVVNDRTKLAFSETLAFVGIHLMFHYLKAAIIKHFKISETIVVVILVTTWNFPWLFEKLWSQHVVKYYWCTSEMQILASLLSHQQPKWHNAIHESGIDLIY